MKLAHLDNLDNLREKKEQMYMNAQLCCNVSWINIHALKLSAAVSLQKYQE